MDRFVFISEVSETNLTKLTSANANPPTAAKPAPVVIITSSSSAPAITTQTDGSEGLYRIVRRWENRNRLTRSRHVAGSLESRAEKRMRLPVYNLPSFRNDSSTTGK